MPINHQKVASRNRRLGPIANMNRTYWWVAGSVIVVLVAAGFVYRTYNHLRVSPSVTYRPASPNKATVERRLESAPLPRRTSIPVIPPDPRFLAILGERRIEVDPADAVTSRLLSEYGAVFAAQGNVIPPPKVVFASEREVSAWQSQIPIRREVIGNFQVELQAPAMEALHAAINEARQAGLSITPRGSDSSRRGYADTVRLWMSRVDSGLSHWVDAQRISPSQADAIKRLDLTDQVAEILELETTEKLYFSTYFDKSILYSVAAPGSSQHLTMLAFDVAEYDNPKVRQILNRHGWFQTIVSDWPHFTYLAAQEAELPSLGLRAMQEKGREFWIPRQASTPGKM